MAHSLYMLTHLLLQHAVREGGSDLLRRLQLRQQATAPRQLPATLCMLFELCLHEHLICYRHLGHAAAGIVMWGGQAAPPSLAPQALTG